MLNTELEVLKFWKEDKIFEKSVYNRKTSQPFVFYDGPPFATGLPHWGHILVSQIKDTMLRYQTQKGRYVPRRWGWDCHGVPIEKIVEKELNIKDKREIEEKVGIQTFNQHCRDKIMLYDEEWRKTIDRIGRWVDMDDQYRTMDNDYIESVWWGLGQLWQKGLIYKDYRISLYSPSTGVPLSHTDVAMEVKYENETLQTPIVRFKVLPASAKRLLKKILEQIAYNYSEQLRIKSDIEKKLVILEHGDKVKRAPYSEIMKDGRPEFSGIEWNNFKTDAETSKETGELRDQLEVVLENIDTLSNLKDILSRNYDLNLLSWTTTPWTLPANVALAAGEDIEYSMYYLGATGEIVILAESRAVPILSLQLHDAVINSPEIQEQLQNVTDSSEYFQKIGVEIIKIVSFKGKDLVGLEYKALFEHNQKIDSYEQKANIYKVYTADFANDEEGTGIVQIAPAYGPEDFELKKQRNLPILTCLNEHGEIRDDLHPDLRLAYGQKYLKANSTILDILEKKGNLFVTMLHSHRIPLFDRDGGKIYYSVQDSWFIAETKLKAKSLELNEEVNWKPENLKHGRFGNGLETAPDWSISRNRYWGNPIPIWQTKDKIKTIFIESLQKLENYSLNPIYKVLNTRDLNPEFYEDGKTVVFTDSHTKLPLGINATQYRSKNLTELRKHKTYELSRIAPIFQAILDEVLQLFEKYRIVQILFNDEEQKLWTTWLYTLNLQSKKNTKWFYFYKRVEEDKDTGEFVPAGGIKLLDLHRPYIDEIMLKDEVGNIYTRIPDVLDCWVESGSMPWSSWHYPFENKDFVEKNLPADWVVESQDQTRGWFRTLHVLTNGVFSKPAFKNINCSGMILAKDGKKMSKSKQNFTDPNILLDKFGSDSVRNYLLSSNLLEAESMNFKDEDLQTVFRETTLLLSNSIKYIQFVLATNQHFILPNSYKHPLNKWWLAYTQDLVRKVDKHMNGYNIQEASRLIIPYIRAFSTWYIRRSKDLHPDFGPETAACLKKTMKLFSTAIACLQPFNAEKIWSYIKDADDVESVHLTDFPFTSDLTSKQQELIDKMEILRDLVSQIHSARKEHQLRVRQPLYADFSKFKIEIGLLELLQKECNLLEKDLSKMEGEMFENTSDFGFIKVDLVIDKSLSILGFARDFERGVQAYRKQKGFKPGQVLRMNWYVGDIKDEELLEETLRAVDWKKLCVEITWEKDEILEPKGEFLIKDLCKIVVG